MENGEIWAFNCQKQEWDWLQNTCNEYPETVSFEVEALQNGATAVDAQKTLIQYGYLVNWGPEI